MSYALRNSLILMVVLVIFIAGGWSYVYFLQAPKINELENKVENKTRDLRQKQQVANRYESVLEQLENAKFHIENYDKAPYDTPNEDKIFDYLNSLNKGNSYTEFTFSFSDSVSRGQYGIINTTISGSGYYRYLVNFVRKIEYNEPLSKIQKLRINPINNLDEYGKVDYNFNLQSFYKRRSLLESSPSFNEIPNVVYSSLHNPFYPLIRQVEPNEEQLTNIEQSKLLALSADKVFVLDQNGMMQKIGLGDKVYLGRLKEIKLNAREAVFQLNKGGIIELVTLEVQQ